MSSLEEYSKSNRSFPNARRKKQEHPKGWEPGLNTSKGEIVSKPLAKAIKPEDHRWDKYLEDLGFNPKDFEIIEPFEIRTWTANMGAGETEQFYYYKVNLKHKSLKVNLVLLFACQIGKWVNAMEMVLQVLFLE